MVFTPRAPSGCRPCGLMVYIWRRIHAAGGPSVLRAGGRSSRMYFSSHATAPVNMPSEGPNTGVYQFVMSCSNALAFCIIWFRE